MHNPMDMSGRHVVVTGAAQGIGRATAELLAKLGADLTLVDMNADGLAAVAAGLPRPVLVLPGSVTDRAFVERAATTAVERFGAIHGLINNAGVTRTAMIESMTVEKWQTVVDENLTGVYHCQQIFGGDMLRRARAGEGDAGAIVNISSDAGRKGTIGQINYGAAKAGVLGITMSAAREWGRFGIRVNSVCFGVVETPMTETVRGEKFRAKYLEAIPMGRFLSAEEAARSICFFVSPAAAHVTGQHLSVNGGSYMSA
jgi:3-oxoacyl-[acyl-carrier protein] reductase